jgi:hypothetical protein
MFGRSGFQVEPGMQGSVLMLAAVREPVALEEGVELIETELDYGDGG